MNRSTFLQCLLASLVGAKAEVAYSAPEQASSFGSLMQELEKKSRGRLGVAVYDSETGSVFEWRGDERFPMCSSFKFLLTAAVLSRVEQGELTLETKVKIPESGLISYSPVTEKFAGKAMAIIDLCEAAMIWSDNSAANLLLSQVGGPEGVTQYIRTLGDKVTRLDRVEPDLNSATPGDPRDTASPNSMLHCMKNLLLGQALSEQSKQRLTEWLLDNRTGGQRLRAGLPKEAKVGDKTGTGEKTTNDIAVVWPKGRGPVLITCFLTESSLNGTAREGIHAAVAEKVSSLW